MQSKNDNQAIEKKLQLVKMIFVTFNQGGIMTTGHGG